MKKVTYYLGVLLASSLLFLSNCSDDEPVPSYTVGGTITGMVDPGSIVLRNGSDEITVTSNGSFTFPTAVTNGGTYNVTVASNPTGQQSSVEGGEGTINGANVTNVTVTCANIPLETYLVGGTVSGLNGTLVLVNGGDEVTISEDGPYVFPTPIADGATYDVKIKSDPESQQSAVSNGKGTIAGADITNANVTCTDLPADSYKVGGNVTGMAGGTLVLANGEDELEITSDGPFQFSMPVEDGGTYNVTIKSQPSGGFCEIENGSGTVDGANVNNVEVTCTPTDTYTVGGTISGLVGTVVIANNGVDELTISENGPFTFKTPVADGSNYKVTVVTQPSGELCSIANGSGTMNGANVNNVEISSQSTPDVGTNYFSVDGSDPSLFYEFQPDKSLLAKSNNGFGTISNVVGLAYDADNDITYAYAGTSKKLLSVNRTTGVATEIADIATSELWDLAYNKNADVLYGINFVYGTLTSINVSTGELTEIASDPSITKVYGLAYDAANDILYGSTSSSGKGQIISISTSTGVATLVGENDFLFSGLAYDSDNNVLLGAQGTDQDDPVMDLYEISTSNGSVTKIGPTGLPSLVDGGMTYIDGDGGLIASWGDGYGKIYGIDKTNGTTTSIGSSGYPSVMGLAWSDADLSIYGLVTSNVAGLVTYNSENGTSTFKVEVDLNLGTLNTALTYDDEADVFYTIVMDQNEDLHLASIDRTTGVGDTRAAIFDDDVHALAYNKESNFLYGATNRKIVTINATSGVVTTELDVDGLDGDISSMNFDPNNKVIVAITDAQKVFAINPISGESSEITVLNEELFGITFKEE